MKALVRMTRTFGMRDCQSVEHEKACLGSQGDERSRDGGQDGTCRLAECRQLKFSNITHACGSSIGAEL